jgi:hypothetical protein
MAPFYVYAELGLNPYLAQWLSALDFEHLDLQDVLTGHFLHKHHHEQGYGKTAGKGFNCGD